MSLLTCAVIFLLWERVSPSVTQNEKLLACNVLLTDQATFNLAEKAKMRTTLEKMLADLGLLGVELVTEGIERQITLKLSADDLHAIEGYVQSDRGSPEDLVAMVWRSLHMKEAEVEDSETLPKPSSIPNADHFNESLVIISQCLLLPCCVFLRLKLGWGRGRILVLAFVMAVFQSWIHLYQEACALKHATLAKHATAAAKGCQDQGWLLEAKNLLEGFFSGVDDPCEAYYLAALVDPAWEIGIQDAFVETVSVFLVAPGKACGESLAGFYSQLLEPLPLVWQLPIIGFGTHLLVVVLLLLFGYEIATPLLSIRPASKNVINTAEVKAVESQTDIPHINWERPKEIVGQVRPHVFDN